MTQCLGVVEGLWHQALLASCITVGAVVMVWKPSHNCRVDKKHRQRYVRFKKLSLLSLSLN